GGVGVAVQRGPAATGGGRGVGSGLPLAVVPARLGVAALAYEPVFFLVFLQAPDVPLRVAAHGADLGRLEIGDGDHAHAALDRFFDGLAADAAVGVQHAFRLLALIFVAEL